MLDENERSDMLRAAGLDDKRSGQLFRKIKLWETSLLNSEETELYVQSPGEEICLFSKTLVTVIRETATYPRTNITFYPLSGIDSCELTINGLDEQGRAVLDYNNKVTTNGYIELKFAIGNKPFCFTSTHQKYACRILSILTNKLLPNLKDEVFLSEMNQTA